MHEDNIIMSRWMKFLGVSRNGDSHKGFTLTEILIALAVVGIIAVLILPVITSRAQNRGFSLSYDAEVREIMNSLEGLTLNENVKSFDKTIMNVDSARAAANAGDERSAANEIHNVEGTAGQFLRKYTKVAKYCGATSVGCFAQTYFKYNDRNREGFILENIISGQEQYTVTVDGVETSLDFSHMACAILKNGMSLCISPQVRNPVTGDLRRPVRGFIDLNGPKEPNVLGRDLRSFSMDLATRTITAPEASNVIIPLTPPVCQDGECCEEKFANGELAKRDLSASIDACCPTLIASQGLGAVLPYCCSTSDTSPECCNYMKGKVNVDELPAACKPEQERTPCQKLALGDASQLAACCDDKNNQYWEEDGHSWDQTCCHLQDDKCCDDMNSKIWTAQNPWAGSCCGKYPNDPLCSAECSAEKWEDACCETVDHGSSIWRENCCSLAVNKDDKNCCKSDGLNVNDKFRTACCLIKNDIDKLGQTRNIECCYQSNWEDDCCAVAALTQKGTGKRDKNNKTWENHCCSQAQYENDAACCRSDGKNGRGNPSKECCSLVSDKSSSTYSANCCKFLDKSSNEYKNYCCEPNTTYAAEDACCNIHGIGCPPTCEDPDYFNSNREMCCANVSEDDARCCLNGKDKYGQGGYTDFCCKRATGNNAKKECCNRKLLSKDVCCTEPVKSIQNGYECAEPLSCDNIFDDYKKLKKGELSPTSSRGKEVKQYWTENSCCDLPKYKNNPIVCPQPPQDPCPYGRGSLDVVHKKPNLNLPDSDVYFVGWNFSEYNNKNITVKLSQVDYRFIKLDASGACIWSSEPRSVYGLTFSANVVNNGFTVGHDLNVPDRPAGSKVEIKDFVRRSGDQSVILVDGEIPACVDKGTVKDHIPCPEPSAQCTPNNITLHSRQEGVICGGAFGRQERFWIESDREVDQEIRVKLQYYYQHLDSSSGTALSDNIEGIVYKEDLVIPKGQKKSAETDVIESRVCVSYGDECDCATPGKNGYGYVFGAKIMYSNSAGIDEKCYPLNSNPDSACPNSYQTLDATWACCLQWGESAVKNSHNDGTIKTCCDYPDIAKDWSICSGNTCSYTSFDGPEDGCCLTAPSHNAAWLSGCCRRESGVMMSDSEECCKFAGRNGEITSSLHPCCSIDSIYDTYSACQTPCDKVKNETATDEDKKACCKKEDDAYWKKHNWSSTCCAFTDDYGNYLLAKDDTFAAMCCSAWVDSQMIKYNPSEYNSSDGKSGGCPRFVEAEDCIQKHFGKADISACTISCYDDKGNPDSQYIHPFCCNLWKTKGKLNNDVKGACCTALQEHDPVWKDFCSTDTCTPNADNASAKCCSEWMPKLPSGGIRPISNGTLLEACCKNDEWVQVDSSDKGFCCRISEHSSYAPCGGGGGTPTPSGNCYATVTLTCKLVSYSNIMCPNYRIQCKLVNETENCKVNNLSVHFGVSSKTSSPNNTGNCVDSSMSTVSKQGVSNFEGYKDIGISGNQFYIDGSCKFDGYSGYSEIKGLNKLNCGSCSGFYDSTYFNTWAQGNAYSELKCTNSNIKGTSQ